MSLAHERLINGLLKGGVGDASPELLQARLSVDVEIVVAAERATLDDLWPAIWTLAALLERQFYGTVYIRCGCDTPLLSPIPLGPRVRFTQGRPRVALSLRIGKIDEGSAALANIIGDAHRGTVTVGTTDEDGLETPTPIECFILAGYLGFAAIAHVVGIPEHRVEYARPTLTIRYDAAALAHRLRELAGVTSIGLGQLGQAYLALLFFWFHGHFGGRRVALVDDDRFQKENGRTQLLLDPRLAEGGPGSWLGQKKVPYVASVIRPWNVDVFERSQKIDWSFRRSIEFPPLALLGLHDLEGRRMACSAGFERLIESGVGKDLMRPRVSWHALPADAALAKQLFPDAAVSATPLTAECDAEWATDLKKTPGACGWLEFKRISATAPCLGAVAVALALAELGGGDGIVAGSALLWSQCVPVHREVLFGERTACVV
jgi:hypothetical protein